MPAVATTKDTAPAAIGASRSARSWALIAPCVAAVRAAPDPALRDDVLT